MIYDRYLNELVTKFISTLFASPFVHLLVL